MSVSSFLFLCSIASQPSWPRLLHLAYFSLSDAGSVSILLAFLLQCPKRISSDYCPLPLCHQSRPPRPSRPPLFFPLLAFYLPPSISLSGVPFSSPPTFNQIHSIYCSNILTSQKCSFRSSFCEPLQERYSSCWSSIFQPNQFSTLPDNFNPRTTWLLPFYTEHGNIFYGCVLFGAFCADG